MHFAKIKSKIIENRLVKNRRKINAPQAKKNNRPCPFGQLLLKLVWLLSLQIISKRYSAQWIIIFKMQKDLSSRGTVN
jgi:hypothetical protein